MLKGGKQDAAEFKKYGLFSLYCIALGLNENKKFCNLDFFEDDDVLATLMKYAKDKQNLGRLKNNSNSKKQIRAATEEIENTEEDKDLKNFRTVGKF